MLGGRRKEVRGVEVWRRREKACFGGFRDGHGGSRSEVGGGGNEDRVCGILIRY